METRVHISGTSPFHIEQWMGILNRRRFYRMLCQIRSRIADIGLFVWCAPFPFTL